MDYFSCVARRTRRQTDLHIVRLFREASRGGEKNVASGSGAKWKGRKRARSQSESMGDDPARVSVSERKVDEPSAPDLRACQCSMGTRRKGRRLDKDFSEFDVVVLGESENEDQGGSVSGGSQLQGSSVGPEANFSEFDVVFLEESEDEEQGGSVSSGSQLQGSSMGPEADKEERVLHAKNDSVEVIKVDASDDDCGNEEKSEHIERDLSSVLEGFEDAIDVDFDKDEFEEIGVKDSDDFDGKGENFDYGVAKKVGEVKETGHRKGEFKVQKKQVRPKDLHLIELLAGCIWGKRNAIKDDSIISEEQVNDVDQRDNESSTLGETLPLIFTFGDKDPEPVEKSESEKELDMLWEQMETALQCEEIGSLVDSGGKIEGGYKGFPASLCKEGKHDLIYDEEIGIYCKFCYYIDVEIKYVSPVVEEHFPCERLGKRLPSDEMDVSLFNGLQFNVSGGSSEVVFCHNDGTAWDIIPGIKGTMYPHQQEGFEFIWTNLAGSIDLHKLKSADPKSVGGCIISHAPGTGKTRLTIMFLQTYLELFPKCQPVIIAPASLLLTWEDEFKKWNTGIPFHNLNNLELSGKEHAFGINKAKNRNQNQNKDTIRMVKLFTWCKEKSILGISYNLYEKLAGEKSKIDMEAENERSVINTKIGVMGRILRDMPGLLVLDEGHTPRNQRSQIWKLLSEIQTEKRIILSGTPFQNNFLELYNTLCLVKPSFPDRIPQELKKFCQRRLLKEKKGLKGGTLENVSPGSSAGYSADKAIHELKLLMSPFVHIHKGSILQKNLPGLRDCVLILNPDNIQKGLLESIEGSQNTFEFEHKVALVSIHPSLFLQCSLSNSEESVVDRDQLEQLKMNPYGGVKTKFLVEFVRLCKARNEKVLVFSQFIDPLCLIMEQLSSVFSWSEGKEVLHMHGKLDQKQRQSLIHGFNDPNSKAKVLLASTRACSEGINLVGASRVVLLDVVWNPSVERQAISRAYRLGQKKFVYTYHLITQGTTECDKYCKQAEKDRISEMVFSAKNNENDKQKTSAAVSEDEVLDEMVWHGKIKDIFDKIIYQPKETDLVESFGS